MVISFTSNGDVAIKTKTESVSLGSDVTIGDFTVPGPGEYDIADIQCEAKPLTESVAYFIRAEDLTTTYLTSIDPEVTKLDDASATHILVVDVRSDDQPESIKPIIKALEPSYVVLTGAGATDKFGDSLGLQKAPEGALKLTRAGLPLEGTFLLTRD